MTMPVLYDVMYVYDVYVCKVFMCDYMCLCIVYFVYAY